MAKIVYNSCFGGFGLSREAMLRAREISGNPSWSFENVERHDPVLVQVVEELGPKANGHYAKLAIAEVESGKKYRIDEYDGNEDVVTPDDYEWTIAP